MDLQNLLAALAVIGLSSNPTAPAPSEESLLASQINHHFQAAGCTDSYTQVRGGVKSNFTCPKLGFDADAFTKKNGGIYLSTIHITNTNGDQKTLIGALALGDATSKYQAALDKVGTPSTTPSPHAKEVASTISQNLINAGCKEGKTNKQSDSINFSCSMGKVSITAKTQEVDGLVATTAKLTGEGESISMLITSATGNHQIDLASLK